MKKLTFIMSSLFRKLSLNGLNFTPTQDLIFNEPQLFLFICVVVRRILLKFRTCLFYSGLIETKYMKFHSRTGCRFLNYTSRCLLNMPLSGSQTPTHQQMKITTLTARYVDRKVFEEKLTSFMKGVCNLRGSQVN